MIVLLWVFTITVSLAAIIYIIGLLLPPVRVVTCSSVFNTTPETLYRIATNNEDWKYRTALRDLAIIERNDDYEVWDEVAKNGVTIRFKTREKKPYSFYAFDMEAKLFTGYWTATFEPAANGATIFTATEYISVKNPFTKTLSYLFFNVKKLMEAYQNDLKAKLAEL